MVPSVKLISNNFLLSLGSSRNFNSATTFSNPAAAVSISPFSFKEYNEAS